MHVPNLMSQNWNLGTKTEALDKQLTSVWFLSAQTSENRLPASVQGGYFGMNRPIKWIIKRTLGPGILNNFQLG